MCAKYGRSRMSNAYTISPADFVGCPANIVQLTTFFLKKKAIFVQLLYVGCQLVGLQVGIWIAVLKLNIYIYVSIKIFIII